MVLRLILILILILILMLMRLILMCLCLCLHLHLHRRSLKCLERLYRLVHLMCCFGQDGFVCRRCITIRP